MEALANFARSQTPFGLAAIGSFVVILALEIRAVRRSRRSPLLWWAILIPAFLAAIAATIQLQRARAILRFEALSDLWNPDAGITLGIELLWGGLILSLLLVPIPLWQALRARRHKNR